MHTITKILHIALLLFYYVSLQAQPIITPDKSCKHNLQIDTRGNHLSGMMIARPTANGPRVLATSYFGPTIFDFTLTDTLKVNSCVEPMRRTKVLQLLERDLRVMLVDKNSAKLKGKTDNVEKRKCGAGFGKSVFIITTDDNGNVAQVLIKHPWIKLRLTVEEIK